MRCVERTLDYMDGLVFVALLRGTGIQAHLFDENFVRQNWFEILAYGGFRIMVPAQDLQTAREILAEFRRGALQLDESEVGRPRCPACHAYSCEFDHRQRRWVFLAALVYLLVQSLLSIFLVGGWILYLVLTSAFLLVTSMPFLLRFVVNNRLRCVECAHAWRDLPRVPFGRQQRETEEALTVQGA